MIAFYQQFRAAGLLAHQAYAAAFYAVRVHAFSASEVTAWALLLASMNIAQTQSAIDAVRHVSPKR